MCIRDRHNTVRIRFFLFLSDYCCFKKVLYEVSILYSVLPLVFNVFQYNWWWCSPITSTLYGCSNVLSYHHVNNYPAFREFIFPTLVDSCVGMLSRFSPKITRKIQVVHWSKCGNQNRYQHWMTFYTCGHFVLLISQRTQIKSFYVVSREHSLHLILFRKHKPILKLEIETNKMDNDKNTTRCERFTLPWCNCEVVICN